VTFRGYGHHQEAQQKHKDNERQTLPEAKMVLESYHAQQNLAMSATFTATASAGTKQKVNGQAESIEAELKYVDNGQDMADVTSPANNF